MREPHVLRPRPGQSWIAKYFRIVKSKRLLSSRNHYLVRETFTLSARNAPVVVFLLDAVRRAPTDARRRTLALAADADAIACSDRMIAFG